mmetsp:Transcript_14285/g.25500  ORF Transcript_14285/g.25500 Transcript_14285/m.25500 type:complete len:607 (+) Transcript_14285:163-1983(+)
MPATPGKIPDGDSSDGKSPAVAKTAEESTRKSQDPSPASPIRDVDTSLSCGRVFGVVQLIMVLVTGAVVGAYLTAHLLESEYKNIVANLQSDQHKSLLKTQNDYIKCQSHLTIEQRSNHEDISSIRILADQTERAFQRRVEQYLNETNMAYRVANEGLEKASSYLKIEVEKHEFTRSQLSQAEALLLAEKNDHELLQQNLTKTIDRLNEEMEDHEATEKSVTRAETLLELEKEHHESTQLQLTQVNKRVQAIRNTMTEMTRQLEDARSQLAEKTKLLEDAALELDAAEDELDRRDIERAECDENHREMTKCRESLKGALENPIVHSDEAAVEAALESERESARKANAQLAQVLEEKEELVQEIKLLDDEGKEMYDAFSVNIAQAKSELKNVERQRDDFMKITKSMKDKITFRSRQAVLDEFGPGPHYVRLIFAFPSFPVNESILLELAPLDIMPHTIHTFLRMIKERMYAEGTFILSRDHIVVGGPVDLHNNENNQILEQRMIRQGYFPDGALLFMEYTPDYPHVQHSVGFNQAGGPVFYFNMKDNTELHAPHNGEGGGNKEGDPCFAKIVEGFDVAKRIAQLREGEGELETSVYIKDTQVVNIAA